MMSAKASKLKLRLLQTKLIGKPRCQDPEEKMTRRHTNFPQNQIRSQNIIDFHRIEKLMLCIFNLVSAGGAAAGYGGVGEWVTQLLALI